jgi:hypothetical protein
MNSNNDSSLHNESVISQFTKQAIPFSQLSEHSNQYGLNTLMYQILMIITL